MTQLYTLADALAAQTAVDWQIQDVVAVASVGLVYGAPAAKKTFAMLDLALCSAIGKPWLGFPVRQGAVLLVDEESGPRRLLRRMGMAARGHLADAGFPVFATSLAGFNFWAGNSKAGRKELETVITQTQAKLVILDALADVMIGADENSVRDTQRVFNTLRQVAEGTGATLLVIHHGLKNGNGYRGSSAINGALDVAIEVESEQDKSLVKFRTTKARDGEPINWAGECHWDAEQFWMTDAQVTGTQAARRIYTKAERFILEYLIANVGATQQDIVNATPVAPTTVKSLISKLSLERLITRTNGGGRGTVATYAVDLLALAGQPL